MAEYIENQIRLGWLTKEQMFEAIEDGNLNQHDICFVKDTHEEYIIDSKLNPIPIRSKLRIYATVESAIEDINNTSNTYAGEILAIRDGEKFISYMVQQFEDGSFYVAPICSDGSVDYNDLQNAPIKQLSGTVTSPIVLTDLESGHYKITGHMITPDEKEVTSYAGNYVIIENISINEKVIKRIGDKNITDYKFKNGNWETDQYATESYVKEQGFVTETVLDIKIAALQASLEEYVREYVATTVELLVVHIVNKTLDNRYAENSDIEKLFEN